MSKKMFPAVDSVDAEQVSEYTGSEISRIADALERISLLLERSALIPAPGGSNLENGIASGMPSLSETEVLTPNEAAQILRISLPKMYDLIHAGKIHSLAVGRKILVSRTSLMAFIKEDK